MCSDGGIYEYIYLGNVMNSVDRLYQYISRNVMSSDGGIYEYIYLGT